MRVLDFMVGLIWLNSENVLYLKELIIMFVDIFLKYVFIKY